MLCLGSLGLLVYDTLNGVWGQDSLRLVVDFVENLLERKLEQVGTAIAKYVQTHLQDGLPAGYQEVVPKLEQVLAYLGVFDAD